MKNQLFNQTLLKKYSKNFKLNPSKHDLLKDYISKVEDGHFKSETKNYLYFYDVILKGVLDYKKEDVLFDEGVDVGTGRSEFVLKSNEKKFMVIELKGQGIDLDKRQSGRSDNKNPVEQAFGYAINTGDVDWIMVSNYEEFRLYNYYEKTKFISFNIDELLDKKKFAYFMLSFSRKSHIESDYITKVREDTLVVDRKLASEFYKLYNETRLMLIKELESESQMERLDAIHYAQLILNRYMFICFAEDTGLLPSQISVDTISTPILKGNIRHRSIWQRLNELCLDINEGNEFKKINEYNGGLFSEDLDFIKIRDIVEDQTIFKNVYQEWNFTEYEKDISHLLGKAGHLINPIYRNMLTISSFDFSTELDVNILGHIFENSIGDIEELKEDTKGRRKKEGIFYTPDYITDYICKNTIIPYLSKSGDVNTVDELLKEYWGSKIEELDQKVKEIKIVDPACGSGAFLNKASDVLLEIHQKIHETRYKDKKDTLIPYFDSIEERREILLNNIYGVDLNMESVEITKLSLFLKVCRKGLKLPNLDKNIKCGNSLIDNPKFTDKPFNWKEEFSEIFKGGGFDVVIGNPPYVSQKGTIMNPNISYDEREYYRTNYETLSKNELKTRGGVKLNLFGLWIEKSMSLIDNNSFIGLIVHKNLLKVESYKFLRKYILDNLSIKEIVDLGAKIFKDVTGETILLIIRKTRVDNNIIKVKTDVDLKNNSFEINEINQDSFYKNDDFIFNIYQTKFISSLKEKMEYNSIKLDEIYDIISFGLNTSNNREYFKEQKINDEYKKAVMGRNIGKWAIKSYGYVFYNDEVLTRKGDISTFNAKEKLILQRISSELTAVYDNEQLYCYNSTNMIIKKSKEYELKYLLCLLNSKLYNYFYINIFSMKAKLTVNVTKGYLSQLPVKKIILSEQKMFIFVADKMIKLNRQLQEEANGFKNWIQKEFNVEKLSQKLEKYYELSEDEFIDEMKKKKLDTKSRKNREYLEREFNESLVIITPLLQEIERTDNEIDQMVYELYGLTDKEIQIIEKSLEK